MKLNWSAIQNDVRSTLPITGPREALLKEIKLCETVDRDHTVLARLSAKSKFSATMYQKLLLEDVRKIAEEKLGKSVEFEFEIESAQESFPVEQMLPQATLAPTNAIEIRFKDRISLQPNFTFDTFVKTPETELACDAIESYFASADHHIPLVVLHGPVGVGKTHLLHAAGWEAKAHLKSCRAKVVTGDDFITDFQTAVTKKTMGDFRKRYRLETDLLLIDDLHSLERAKGTQEELFNLINHFAVTNRMMVITCDKPVASLSGLEERLRSRLLGGLVISIEQPSVSSRRDILAAKLSAQNVSLESEVVAQLSAATGPCVRSIQGLVHRLQLLSRREPLSRDSLKSLLPKESAPTNASAIMLDVISQFKVSDADIRGKSRRRPHVTARHEVMRRFRKLGMSYAEIGRHLNRNHSTVMQALRAKSS